MSLEPTLNDILFAVVELDIGDAKKTRIKSYVRTAYHLGKLNKVNLTNLSNMSRNEIVAERRKL